MLAARLGFLHQNERPFQGKALMTIWKPAHRFGLKPNKNIFLMFRPNQLSCSVMHDMRLIRFDCFWVSHHFPVEHKHWNGPRLEAGSSELRTKWWTGTSSREAEHEVSPLIQSHRRSWAVPEESAGLQSHQRERTTNNKLQCGKVYGTFKFMMLRRCRAGGLHSGRG